MKKVLILGAGLVVKPLVKYLLNQNFKVKVASRTLKKAESLVENHPNGQACVLLADDLKGMEELILENDLTISMLPPKYHVRVAELCIKHKKSMITTSYVSEQMRLLDKEARKSGIIILNEIGLDPGIDHMSAMKIINKVKQNDGKVISFLSSCGALPAPEAINNPFRYKFSWSPMGVLLAVKNNALYLENGKEVNVPAEKLFENFKVVNIKGLGDFEVYPNRNSLLYINQYNIPETKTMIRGTFRNLGHCHTWSNFYKLGLLDNEKTYNLDGKSPKQFIADLINSKDLENIESHLKDYLRLDEKSDFIYKLKWIGMLEDIPLPMERATPIEVLAHFLFQKLSYKDGERDMIVLQHEFIVEYPNKKEKIISDLIEYGIPNGDTAIARTVALPAAIATKLILTEKINLTGVYIPTIPEIYNPVLEELEQLGIKFNETIETISN